MANKQRIQVLVALGANLGDPAEQIFAAWGRLSDFSHVSPISISPLFSTKPAGGPNGQPDFLNAAALIETDLPPFELLELLQKIEKEGGRVRHAFWGARTIDLDILLYGQRVIQSPRLVIPHPLMAWRPFVLEPAACVAPKMLHPLYKRTITELLNLMRMNFRLAGLDMMNRRPFTGPVFQF